MNNRYVISLGACLVWLSSSFPTTQKGCYVLARYAAEEAESARVAAELHRWIEQNPAFVRGFWIHIVYERDNSCWHELDLTEPDPLIVSC